jgi:hypothetical protein
MPQLRTSSAIDDIEGGLSCRGADIKHPAWKQQSDRMDPVRYLGDDVSFYISSELDLHPMVQLEARFTMVKPDGMTMHTHT